MSKTNYLENSITQHMFGGQAYPKPAQWWVSIYQADPGEDPALGITPELGTRKQVTSWTISNNQASNSHSVTFDIVPLLTTWVITNFCIWDNQTGGNPLYTGVLSNPQTRTSGQSLIIEAGNIVITEL